MGGIWARYEDKAIYMYVLLQGKYNIVIVKTKKKVLTVSIPVSESSRIERSITYNN